MNLFNITSLEGVQGVAEPELRGPQGIVLALETWRRAMGKMLQAEQQKSGELTCCILHFSGYGIPPFFLVS